MAMEARPLGAVPCLAFSPRDILAEFHVLITIEKNLLP
jgi:hypothetical protein